jgi:hypothetical protein
MGKEESMTTSTFESFVKNAANLSDLKAALHRYHDDRYDEGLKIWAEYQAKLQQIEAYVEGRFDAGDTESEMLKGIPLEFLSFAKDLWGKQLERYGYGVIASFRLRQCLRVGRMSIRTQIAYSKPLHKRQSEWSKSRKN